MSSNERALANVSQLTDDYLAKLRRRLSSRLVRSGDCLEWQGGKAGRGYGVLCVVVNGKKRMEYAHRVSWIIAHGEIPVGMMVLHRCDNPSCANPEHLFLGTQKENMSDCSRKGRVRNGARFSLDIAREIRARHREGGCTQASLAAEYGMSFQHVSNIVNGTRWKESAR